nr:hypothetical protein CFP56_69501 [Quercus suber]
MPHTGRNVLVLSPCLPFTLSQYRSRTPDNRRWCDSAWVLSILPERSQTTIPPYCPVACRRNQPQSSIASPPPLSRHAICNSGPLRRPNAGDRQKTLTSQGSPCGAALSLQKTWTRMDDDIENHLQGTDHRSDKDDYSTRRMSNAWTRSDTIRHDNSAHLGIHRFSKADVGHEKRSTRRRNCRSEKSVCWRY